MPSEYLYRSDGTGELRTHPGIGIICLLAESYFLSGHIELGGIGHEQIDVYVAVIHGVDVSGQGWNEAAYVRRAACASEPWLTLMLSD